MRFAVRSSLLSLGLVVALASAGLSAAKTSTSTKSTAKTTHVVQGTTQLKGEYAEFGKTYTLGKDDPMNITLRSAEYSVEPITIGEMTYMPTAEQKMLVLHLTYHNPQPSERFSRYDSFTFTVVDSKGENHDGLLDAGTEKDKTPFSMSMKPAQKVDVVGVMMVPASGVMPKLIIKSSDELVLRYDLRDKVKKLPEPFADPSDKTGLTALTTVNAKMGTYYPFGVLSAKVNKAEYSSATSMGEDELEEGQRYLLVEMDVKNVSAEQQFMRYDTFNPVILDVDDVEVANCNEMYQKSKDKSVNMSLKAGQEITVRCAFKIPDDTDLKALNMFYEENRTFSFDISGVK